MSKVVVFGNSSLAALAHFYLTHDSPHEVVAFTVDRAVWEGCEKTYLGLPLVPFDALEARFPPDGFKLFLPISFRQMSHLRAARFAEARQRGYEMISYVSSRATVWPGFEPGENCFIFEDNTIQPFVRMGEDCILWSGNHVGHHSVIGDHVFITSQVVICGACTIEDHCFLGVNSTIRDETVVARETLVGAGSLILADTQPFAVYAPRGTEPTGFRSDRLMSISHKT